MTFELAGAYEERYDTAVQHSFPSYPRGLDQRYFASGQQYFAAFDGFGSNYDIVAVEERFRIEGMGFPFTGIIDLVLRDRQTGELVVIDHKAKSAQTLRKQMTTYRRQLYLYASAVQQIFGQLPARLQFNLFRENVIVDEPYDPAAHREALCWVRDTIAQIQQEMKWSAHPSAYFCRHVCSCALHCPNCR